MIVWPTGASVTMSRHQHSREVEEMISTLAQWIDAQNKVRGILGHTGRSQVDQQTLDQLRSLGYLGDPLDSKPRFCFSSLHRAGCGNHPEHFSCRVQVSASNPSESETHCARRGWNGSRLCGTPLEFPA